MSKELRPQVKELSNEVYESIDQYVNELLQECQSKLNIKYGDCEPSLVFRLHEKQQELTNTVLEILDSQLEE